MLRPRFNLVSVVVIVIATAAATFAMLWVQGGGFAGHRGFPFAWYWWRDVSINDDPFSGFRWSGFIADVTVWLAVIIAFGMFVERVTQQLSRRHEVANAA
jgi:hypothetical protein